MIPAEFIRDAVEHLDRNLINGDVNAFYKKTDELLLKLSDNLISGKLKEALANLTDEIIPFLNGNVGITKSVQSLSFLSDLDEVKKTNFESLAILVGSSNPHKVQRIHLLVSVYKIAHNRVSNHCLQ